MGAWGAGSFENDTAQDFAAEIESADDLMKPLRAADEGEEINADLACEIIVAAECVAAMRGHPPEHLYGDLYELVETLGKPTPEHHRLAKQCLSAVWADSELKELWEEDDPADWNAVMDDLTKRLARKPKPLIAPDLGGLSDDDPCMVCNKPVGAGRSSLLDLKINMDHGATMHIGGVVHIDCINEALHADRRFK